MTSNQESEINSQLLSATQYLLERAKALGAQMADCACHSSQSLEVSVRMGNLENVEREESREAGLRVIIGKKQAGAKTSAFTKGALDELAGVWSQWQMRLPKMIIAALLNAALRQMK